MNGLAMIGQLLIRAYGDINGFFVLWLARIGWIIILPVSFFSFFVCVKSTTVWHSDGVYGDSHSMLKWNSCPLFLTSLYYGLREGVCLFCCWLGDLATSKRLGRISRALWLSVRYDNAGYKGPPCCTEKLWIAHALKPNFSTEVKA
jgi:hypothetical protein